MKWLFKKYNTNITFFTYYQFSSVAQSCLTLCDPMNRSTPGLPVHHQLPEFTQTHVHRVGDAIQPSHPLPSPSLPALNLSQHQGLFFSFSWFLYLYFQLSWLCRVFSNESALHIRWPKYWSFSFNISPSNEYSGLISFRMDWVDLLTVQFSVFSLSFLSLSLPAFKWPSLTHVALLMIWWNKQFKYSQDIPWSIILLNKLAAVSGRKEVPSEGQTMRKVLWPWVLS